MVVTQETNKSETTVESILAGPTVTLDGRYARGNVIGRGASGKVYEGVHLAMNRKVAIKVLNPKHTDKSYRIRFEREAVAVSRMSHPNCIGIYDYGEDSDPRVPLHGDGVCRRRAALRTPR